MTMRSTWFASDYHFYHENIIRFCDRPFSCAQEMNEILIQNHNKLVLPQDTVYFLGDFLNPKGKHPQEFIKRLNGNFVFIQGNHDGKKLLERLPNWAPRLYLNFGGYRFLLQHYPQYPVEIQNEWTKGKEVLPSDKKDYDVNFILSGHIHNNHFDRDGKKVGLRWTGRSLNLSVEVNKYRPVHTDEVLAYCNRRKEQMSYKQYKILVPADEAVL